MKKKVGIVSLGCPKNLVDSEIMLGLLKKNEYEIVNNKGEADILIVNTCGFIESAKAESISTILEMAQCKEKNCELLIVTGCLAERYKEEIIKEIPEVDAVVGTGNYGEIADIIAEFNHEKKSVRYGNLNEIAYLENERLVSTKNGYAYLKIAEGCDNCCTYCIIPSLRGRFRSRKIEDIIKETEALVKGGAKEIILVAQDVTRYGVDIYGERSLVKLLKRLSDIEGVEWIRLLYCYPDEIDMELIDEIAANEKVLKYIDIPLQHASDKILKAMGRRGNSQLNENIIKTLREKIPGIVIRTSFIVGFPGEDEEDFKKLYDFIDRYKVDRLGVFEYSKEEDTKAAKLKNQVPKRVKAKRYKEIMSLQREISGLKNHERVNKTYRTLVEGVADDGIFYYGRTFAEAPEIDSYLYFTSEEPLKIGEFTNVRVVSSEDYDLTGVVVNEFA
jgi:ribosomal protein S12 methylthiotransferase